MKRRRPRSVAVLALSLLLLPSSACRVGFYPIDEELVPCWPNCDGNNNGDNPPMPWGEYAATLDVPDCPPSDYPPLVVNTTADELDGGDTIADPSQAGDHLSFVEALCIAHYREGPNTIRFDPSVFPVDDPKTIMITVDNFLPASCCRKVCIDGRNRGVIIDWTDEAQLGPFFWCLSDGSLQVGLTVLNPPNRLYFDTSQIAGCRLATDGYETFPGPGYRTLRPGPRAILGPGNVISGSDRAVRIIGVDMVGGCPSIQGNYFGYDPITGVNLGLDTAIHIWGMDSSDALTIEDNVFAANRSTIRFSFVDSETDKILILRNNFFGVTRDGSPLPQPVKGINIDTSFRGTVTIGPTNIIRGVEAGIVIGGDGSNVRITRNSISGNEEGIAFGGTSPVDEPTITSANSSGVNGTCPVAGTVEVFSDPEDQGETFLGEVNCNGTAPWTLSVSVPRGRNVTATLTDGNGRTSAFSAPYPVP